MAYSFQTPAPRAAAPFSSMREKEWELRCAAEKGDLAAVKKHLEVGVNVNSTDIVRNVKVTIL